MSSELKTNKISPATGTLTTLGDASDVFQLPASAEIDIASGATLDVNGTIDATGATITGFPQGGLQHITTVTNTSDASSIDIAGCFTSTYNNYRVVMNNVSPVTDGKHIYLNFGNSDLSTIEDGYQWIIAMWSASISSENFYYENVSSGSSGIELAHNMSNDTLYGVNMSFDIYAPYANDTYTAFSGSGQTFNNDANWGNMYLFSGSTRAADSSVRSESMRITSQSGNVDGNTNCSVTVFGYAES